jgi:hypothetical protein
VNLVPAVRSFSVEQFDVRAAADTRSEMGVGVDEVSPRGIDLARLRSRIESLEGECGCESGAMAGFSTLALFMTSVAVLGPWAGGWVWSAISGFFAFALAVAIGKHTSLSRAHKERAKLLAALERLNSGLQGETHHA